MRLELLEKLYDGHLAETWIGRLSSESGPELVTVRRLLKQVIQTQGVATALAKSSANLMTLNHDNLCRHIGFYYSGGEYYWLSRRTEGFDLATVQTRLATREVHISSLKSLQIGLDFVRGLRVLHDQGMVHGGPSTRYVLVGYDGVARLDGVGFEIALLSCKELKQKARNGRSQLAPEVLQGRMPTPQADIFSAAAVVYILLTGRPPLGNNPRSSAGMSVRNASIEPPTKLDRSLPFTCDALFDKALGLTPLGRHASGTDLFEAFSRLRATMLKGPDEGRQGIQEFIETLYPNEAIVPGKPGILERPAQGEEIQLVQVAGGDKPLGSNQSGEVDQEALARIAAWEAKFGAPLHADSGGGGQPPPLPAKQEPSGKQKGKKPKIDKASDLVVVDWTGLSDEQGRPVDPSPDTDWDRIPTQVAAPPDGAVQEPVDEPVDDEFVTEPEMPIEGLEDHDPVSPEMEAEVISSPPDSDEEPVAGSSDEDDTIQVQSLAGDTTPNGEPVMNTTRMKLPFWRRPAGWLTLIVILALVITVVVVLSGKSSTTQDSPAAADAPKPSGDTTPVGFLSVTTDSPAKITLDGELLPGLTPLTNKLVRAGRHRLLLDTKQGERLFDETITVKAGEHRTIRVVAATSKATAVPQPATAIGEPQKKPRPKSTRKKRTKKRKRRRKKRTRRRP